LGQGKDEPHRSVRKRVPIVLRVRRPGKTTRAGGREREPKRGLGVQGSVKIIRSIYQAEWTGALGMCQCDTVGRKNGGVNKKRCE